MGDYRSTDFGFHTKIPTTSNSNTNNSTGSLNMHVKISLDWEKFDHKPSKDKQYKDYKDFKGKPLSEVGILGGRVGKNVERIDLADLAHKVAKDGQTFSPFIFGFFEAIPGNPASKTRRRLSHLFESCEVLCLDFDQGDPIEGIYKTCEENNLTPNFVHESFSSCEELRKYRVMFVLDKVYTDHDEVKMTINTLLKMFPTADTQAKDLSRIFFGSNSGILEFNDQVKNHIPIDPEIRESYNKNMFADIEEKEADDNGFIFGTEEIDTEICQSAD